MQTNRFARTLRALILIPFLTTPLPAAEAGEGSGHPPAAETQGEVPSASPARAASGSAVEAALDVLVQEALQSNRELAARRHALAAARLRIPQAGALADPMAGIALSNLPVDSLSTDETPMTGIELRWSQMLPWPGKRALREEAAGWEAAAVEQELGDATNLLVSRVKEAYFDLYLLDRSLEITRRNKDLLEHMVRIAEEKYAVGKGVQADVTRAQVALSRVLDRILLLEEQREGVLARLNALLARSPQEPTLVPGDLPGRRVGTEMEDLLLLADGNSPMLSRLDQLVEEARTRHELARKGLRPDFTVGFAYRLRDDVPMDPVSGEDFVSASLMFNVPIFAASKQKLKIAETAAELARREALREDAEYRLHSRIHDLAAGLRGARNEILLYETGILPQAEQSLASSRVGYEVNKVDFLAFLDAQITLFNEEIGYYRAVTRYQKDLAELEAVVGVPLGRPAGRSGEEM